MRVKLPNYYTVSGEFQSNFIELNRNNVRQIHEIFPQRVRHVHYTSRVATAANKFTFIDVFFTFYTYLKGDPNKTFRFQIPYILERNPLLQQHLQIFF